MVLCSMKVELYRRCLATLFDGASNVAGLPIGFQMIGRPWDEASLMYAASVIEAAVKEDLRLPAIFYDVLSSK